MLEPGVGVLSYMLTKDKGFIWLLRREGTTFYETPAREQEVTKIVAQYRNAIQHVEPVDDDLITLYTLLIKPVEKRSGSVNLYRNYFQMVLCIFLSFSALKDENSLFSGSISRSSMHHPPQYSKFTFAKRQKDKASKVLAVGKP